MFFTQNIYYLC